MLCACRALVQNFHQGHNQQANAYNQAQAYANYGGYGAYGYGNGASGGPGGSAAAQQQYWNYYQQYYSNPQLVQQQWQRYTGILIYEGENSYNCTFF